MARIRSRRKRKRIAILHRKMQLKRINAIMKLLYKNVPRSKVLRK